MKINLPKIYSQNDVNWKNKTLGTKGTIGVYGCLLTDIAMLCCYYGKNETPDTLNEKLKVNGGYESGNLYVWGALSKIYSDISYQGQVFTPDPLTKTQMDFIRARIDEGYPVILQIDTVPATAQLDEHWVLVVDYDGDDFILADPWDGAIKRITSWGAKPQEMIYAYAWYKGTPVKPQEDPLTVCLRLHSEAVAELDKLKPELEGQKQTIINLNGQIADLEKEKNRLAEDLKECQLINKEHIDCQKKIIEATELKNTAEQNYEKAKGDWQLKEIEYNKRIKFLETKIQGYKMPIKSLLVDIWQKVVEG